MHITEQQFEYLSSKRNPSILKRKGFFTMTKKPPQTSEEKEAASNNMGLGIGVGMALGAAFGLLFFDNLALGMGLGIALGVAICAGMDQKSSKDKK
jgi:transketolase N-terminal domain/subunit